MFATVVTAWEFLAFDIWPSFSHRFVLASYFQISSRREPELSRPPKSRLSVTHQSSHTSHPSCTRYSSDSLPSHPPLLQVMLSPQSTHLPHRSQSWRAIIVAQSYLLSPTALLLGDLSSAKMMCTF